MFYIRSALIVLLTMNLSAVAEIIPNASYAVVKKEGSWIKLILENITGRRRLPYKTVFYTFDGNPIKEVAGAIEPYTIYTQLDPSAPNPQPVQFTVIWHDFYITPKYYIHFYDKNGNELRHFIYKGPFPVTVDELKKYEKIDAVGVKKLDLSVVKDATRFWTGQFTYLLLHRQKYSQS